MQRHKRNDRVRLRVRELLQAHGMTIERLSELSGVPKGTIGDLLTGRTALPSDENLVRLSDALGTDTLIVVEPLHAYLH